jgi:hypothetical protein
MATQLKDILNDFAEALKTAVENPQETITDGWIETKEALIEEALDAYKYHCIGE